MIHPPYIRKGDTIGIVAPAGKLKKSEIAQAVELFQSWGLKVKTGRHVFRRSGSFAGTDDERAADLQEMLDDPAISAIICARGGYGTIRIIDRLDFKLFRKHAKWIVGYSDITVLHAKLQQELGMESIHGAMPRVVAPKEPDLVSFESLRAMLFGEVKEYRVPSHRLNRAGKASGALVGGNLSVLYSIAGTVFEPDTRGSILLIEDLNESLYHIDRMMMNLKVRGKLATLSGLIVGQMLDMKGSPGGFNKPAYQVIHEAVSEYDFPVMFGFPSGHDHPNLALPMGREVRMEVGRAQCGVAWERDD